MFNHLLRKNIIFSIVWVSWFFFSTKCLCFTFASLALATEPPDEAQTLGTEEKPRHPHNRKDYILS
jgi:hypothetical protein